MIFLKSLIQTLDSFLLEKLSYCIILRLESQRVTNLEIRIAAISTCCIGGASAMVAEAATEISGGHGRRSS
jgi:hypothetical protein